MSDLTQFRDHCRAMAVARHKPECHLPRPPLWTEVRPHPGCKGCNPEAERDLFARLADEIDGYLHVDGEPTLFEKTP